MAEYNPNLRCRVNKADLWRGVSRVQSLQPKSFVAWPCRWCPDSGTRPQPGHNQSPHIPIDGEERSSWCQGWVWGNHRHLTLVTTPAAANTGLFLVINGDPSNWERESESLRTLKWCWAERYLEWSEWPGRGFGDKSWSHNGEWRVSEEDVSPLDDENSLYSHPNKTDSWPGENVINHFYISP